MATPAEPRGEKKLFFVQILGGEKLLNLLKSAGEIFLSGLRGALKFQTRFGSFFGSVFAFFKPFFVSIKFGGSFVLQTCRPNNFLIAGNDGRGSRAVPRPDRPGAITMTYKFRSQ